MMYFLMFHAKPKPDAEDIEDVGGAFINCYILADSVEEADCISRIDIEKMKWDILEREDAYEITSDSISDDGREYFEQALIDQAVYVFHTYPIDEIED